jgi:O-antigen/teichoic acid export membrane protein
LILLWAIKHIFKHEESEEIKLPSMFKYFLPTFFALLGLTLLYNIDLILVKKFFSPEIAGQYSAMAILGRVIYFASGAIVGVMFPMVAEAHRKNDNHRKILENALCFIFLGSLLTVLLYFIFPEFLIKILVGEKFLPIAGYVGWFAIAMSIFSLINALSQYFLSIKKMNFIYIILFGVVAQISLLFIFHSSLVQIIWVMNIAMGSIFLALLAFYFLSQRNDTQNT